MTTRTVRTARTNNLGTIAVLPYGTSNSARDLVNAINEASGNNERAVRLRVNGSVYRGSPTSLVVNWGNSNTTQGAWEGIVGAGRGLNPPSAIHNASNKRLSFQMFQEHSIPTVEWTTDRAVAEGWLSDGGVVYARTRLQGHSGEGIVVCSNIALPDLGGISTSSVIVDAPLYTKGITQQRREFRIHVVNGAIVHTQQKKRSENWRDNPNYSNVVRNYHTGWIYAVQDVAANAAANQAAINAVRALGLDFGAVDVITRGDNAWVLEVNTAPGLQGTNLTNYANQFLSILRNEQAPAPVVEPVAVVEPEPIAVPEEIAPAVLTEGTPVFAFEEAVAPRVERVVNDPATMPPASWSRYSRLTTDAERISFLMEELRISRGTMNAVTASANRAHGELLGARSQIGDLQTMVERLTRELATANEAATRVSTAAVGAPANGVFYRATLNDEPTVVRYDSNLNVYFAIGWDIPLSESEIVRGEAIR